VIPDAEMVEARLRVVRELPWPIPAAILTEMSDEDLDWLAAAPDRDEYWRTLNGVVRRVQNGARPRDAPPF
jgi:hypothetical protein